MSGIIKSYAELEKNDSYELEYEEYLGDIQSSGIILRHKKSGARVCVMSSEDENKLFCAAFKTPVFDSTGVPHILEHSVLNGSKNFPSRDPFMQLVKGSLNTFLNAMTYPDKTMYPVASCNDKDFKNLMNVYLDAVFFPNIYKYREVFMQEGWHYELNSPEDELKINGVVYSEMKGATSSADSLIWDYTSKHLFPDTTYGENSGGDPEFIPSLTYENFIAFHKKHYHPSNSYIFIYGNSDMDERLRFLDENYLSLFDTSTPNSFIPTQPHFGTKTPKIAEEKYSVSSADETDGKSFFSYSVLIGKNNDPTEEMALSVLLNALLGTEGAPVKQALIDAGIGEDIYGGYENYMQEDFVTFVAKNAKAEDRDRFVQVINEALEKEVKNGVNKKTLLSIINRNEFSFREADYGSFPRGLEYATRMLQTWLYDDSDAFTLMHPLKEFDRLKKLAETDYFEKLIEKYLLSSDHSVLLTLSPERGLDDRKEEELKKKLADYKSSLTEEEVGKIIADTKALREYQEKEPTKEETECIPFLERSDIPLDTIPFTNRETSIGGTKTVAHDIETGGISYIGMNFDLGRIPKKYIPYVGLIGNLLGRVDTDKFSFAELDSEIKLTTGWLGFAPTTIGLYKKADDYRALYTVSLRILPEKTKESLDLVYDILTTSKLGDKKRLREIICELKSDKQREIAYSGHSIAMGRSRSYYSKFYAYLQSLSAVDFYLFLKDAAENFDSKSDEIIDSITKTAEYIFDPARLTVSIAASSDGYGEFEKYLPEFTSKLSALPHSTLGEEEEFIPVNRREGIIIPSQVQYVARSGNFESAGYSFTPAMQVVRCAVNNDYLYQQLRVKGGAYGCGCALSGENGNASFYSFRDPKLTETIEVYKKTADFIEASNYSYEDITRFIIGTFSAYEKPLSASGRAWRSFNAYISGLTYDDVVNDRAQMLAVTPEVFRETADAFRSLNGQDYLCAVGGEKILREHPELFDSYIVI